MYIHTRSVCDLITRKIFITAGNEMSEAAAEARAAEERRLFEEAKEAQVRDLASQRRV